MKIIFSRKGFDKGNGGYPSPILPDGELVSIPIPQKGSSSCFGDVIAKEHHTMFTAIYPKLRLSDACHPDPQLSAQHALGAFGQSGAAQSHLKNHMVGAGDLFLFFGSFRDVCKNDGRWRFNKTSLERHIIFGWLQIGNVFDLSSGDEHCLKVYPDLKAQHHPHIGRNCQPLNTLYTAAKTFNIADKTFVGHGIFRFVKTQRVLTKANQPLKSIWMLPEEFHPTAGASLSFHENIERWTLGTNGLLLNTVARGQEFVLTSSNTDFITNYLKNIFR